MAYVYEHINPETGKVIYVGKGCKNRAKWFSGRTHTDLLFEFINKGYSKNEIVRIVKDNISDKEACNLEIELIRQYGVENLFNITLGGQLGPKGEANWQWKEIKESDFLNLLKKGGYITQICKKLNTNPNLLKRKFYPKITLNQYCENNNIVYAADASGKGNPSYKHLDKKEFMRLIKKGMKLTEIAPLLNFSHGGLCRKYKKEFNVKSLKELL